MKLLETLSERIDPAHTALPVVDMQNVGFLFGDLTGGEEIARIWDRS